MKWRPHDLPRDGIQTHGAHVNRDRNEGFPVSFDWPLGTLDFVDKLIRVTDGHGVCRGFFRIGASLQYAKSPDTPPQKGVKAALEFKDCTDFWASFPSWVRRGVTSAFAGTTQLAVR